MMRHLQADAPATSTLDVYLREIKVNVLLTAAEEVALAAAIARGDAEAKSQMIRSNLRLVVKIARDYAGRSLSIDDLIGEGNLGLIRAASEYNPTFGTRFSTYASYWIKQAIRHAFTNTAAAIRLPAHIVNLLTKWRRVEGLLAREFGRQPTEEQTEERLAVQFGLTHAQVEMVRRARRAARLRFESGLTGDHDVWSVDDIPDDRKAPDVAIEADDECRQALRRLDRLDDRSRSIIVMRFGLDGGKPMTLKDIGLRLRVTREWVRQIELRALAKLKELDALEPAAAARRSRRNTSTAGLISGSDTMCIPKPPTARRVSSAGF